MDIIHSKIFVSGIIIYQRPNLQFFIDRKNSTSFGITNNKIFNFTNWPLLQRSWYGNEIKNSSQGEPELKNRIKIFTSFHFFYTFVRWRYYSRTLPANKKQGLSDRSNSSDKKQIRSTASTRLVLKFKDFQRPLVSW